MRSQARDDLLRILIGHEPHVDPRVRLRGRDGLRFGAEVPGPQALDVERGLEGVGPLDLDAVPAADESIDAHLVAVLIQQLDREGVDHRQLRRCGRPDTGPQPRACGQPVGVDERRDRLGDPRRRVRQQVRGTRVCVVRDRSRDELDDHDPARPRGDLRPALQVEPAALDQRAVGLAQLGPLPRAARRATHCPTPPRPRRGSRTRQGSGPIAARYASTAHRHAAGTRPCCRSRRGRRGGRRGPPARRAASSTARAVTAGCTS